MALLSTHTVPTVHGIVWHTDISIPISISNNKDTRPAAEERRARKRLHCRYKPASLGLPLTPVAATAAERRSGSPPALVGARQASHVLLAPPVAAAVGNNVGQ